MPQGGSGRAPAVSDTHWFLIFTGWTRDLTPLGHLLHLPSIISSLYLYPETIPVSSHSYTLPLWPKHLHASLPFTMFILLLYLPFSPVTFTYTSPYILIPVLYLRTVCATLYVSSLHHILSLNPFSCTSAPLHYTAPVSRHQHIKSYGQALDLHIWCGKFLIIFHSLKDMWQII